VARKYLPSSLRGQLVYLLAARGASQSKLARWLGTESGCGSGCKTCNSCAEPEPESSKRVIKIHHRG
jgi:hypothetical protein